MREFRLRLFVLILVSLLVALIIFCILLIPSYFVSKEIFSGVSKEKEVVEQSLLSRESSDLKNRLAEAKETLNILSPREKGLSIETLIDKVVAVKNTGIKITRFDYLVLADGKRQLALSGISEDRDSLLAFKNKLTETKLFSAIILPVSNFTDENNIEFNITLSGNF